MVLMMLTGANHSDAPLRASLTAHRHDSNPSSGGRREQNDASAGDQSSQSQRQQGSQRAQWHVEMAELHRVYPPMTRTEAPHYNATAVFEAEIAGLGRGQVEATRQDRDC
jgi:hypothetical protein